MSVTATILALWVAFAATHICLSSPSFRPKLVGALGDRGFLGLYSAIALAVFVPLVWVYSDNKHVGGFLWHWGDNTFVRYAVYVGMALAVSLIVGGNATPSPASLGGKPGSSDVRGVLRVTRHPMMMGIGLFGILHLLVARIHASDLAFFAGLPIFVVLGCWHQDRRKLVTQGEAFLRFHAKTAFFPFARGGFGGFAEVPVAVGIALAGTLALRYFHASLFG